MASAGSFPTLSVVTPSYNPGPYFEPALASVLSQLGDTDEFVIQDGLSDDGTQELIADAAARDGRVRAVVEADAGQSDALNRCLRRASNQWILWLNADDILLPGAISAVRSAILEDPTLDLVIGAHQIIRADGTVVDTFPGRSLVRERLVTGGCAAFSGSIAMRADYLRGVGGFETHLNTVMDLSLQLRMSETSPRQVVVNAPIGALRFHELSKTANLWRQFVRESHTVRMRHAPTLRLKMRASVSTFLHLCLQPIFRLRLTETYRRLRRMMRRDAVST